MTDQPNNPLHGVTLEAILTELVERMGWERLATIIPVRCFRFDPSIKASLKFLRRTPWARQRLEDLYLRSRRYRPSRRERPDPSSESKNSKPDDASPDGETR